MKNIIFLSSLILFIACKTEKTNKAANLITELDSVSYSLGVNIGENIKTNLMFRPRLTFCRFLVKILKRKPWCFGLVRLFAACWWIKKRKRKLCFGPDRRFAVCLSRFKKCMFRPKSTFCCFVCENWKEKEKNKSMIRPRLICCSVIEKRN